MDDKRGAMMRENINSEPMLVYGFLNFGRGLLGIPWRGMDESMDGPLFPGVSPLQRE
jgi:hypothetical protein